MLKDREHSLWWSVIELQTSRQESKMKAMCEDEVDKVSEYLVGFENSYIINECSDDVENHNRQQMLIDNLRQLAKRIEMGFQGLERFVQFEHYRQDQRQFIVRDIVKYYERIKESRAAAIF